jgi:hypothetical protein
MTTEALRRDPEEWSTREAAEAHAYRLDMDRPTGAPRFEVVSGSPYGDVWFVVDAAGNRVPNPEKPQPVNPYGNRRPDRFEPAGSTHRSGTRSNPL